MAPGKKCWGGGGQLLSESNSEKSEQPFMDYVCHIGFKCDYIYSLKKYFFLSENGNCLYCKHCRCLANLAKLANLANTLKYRRRYLLFLQIFPHYL